MVVQVHSRLKRRAPFNKHFRIAQEADTASHLARASHPQRRFVLLYVHHAGCGLAQPGDHRVDDKRDHRHHSFKRIAILRLEAMRLDRLRELASPKLIRQRKSFRARCICVLASHSLSPLRLLTLVPGAPREPRMGESGRGRLRLDRLPATATERLSSPAGPPRAGRGGPGRRHSSRKSRKSPACRPALRCGPSAYASGAVRSSPAG